MNDSKADLRRVGTGGRKSNWQRRVQIVFEAQDKSTHEIDSAQQTRVPTEVVRQYLCRMSRHLQLRDLPRYEQSQWNTTLAFALANGRFE